MSSVLGELLPLAVGVAVSPVPIIAVILVLLAPRAGSTSLTFAAGWVIGIAAAAVLFVLISGAAPTDDDGEPSAVVSWIKLILGAALLLLSWRNWRNRPRPGSKAELPGWLTAIDKVTPGRAAGLGFVLAAINPKNLGLLAAAGGAIGAAGASTSEVTILLVIFVVLAACTVVLPVIVYRLAGARAQAPLENLKQWLEANNNTVMVILLLTMGAVLVGKGIGGLV